MELQGINLEQLSLYFCDNGNDDLYDDLLPEVNGFDMSIDKNIASVIDEYNSTAKGDTVDAEYIFFTLNSFKYGTFLMIHDETTQTELVNKLLKLNCKDICIKYGIKRS